MTTFTPGPWAVKEYNNGHTGEYGLHGVFQERQSSEQQTPIVEKVWGSTLPESDANARLIAAAPELLEACRRAIPWLGKLIASGEHNNAVLPMDAVRTLDILKAIVDKAAGR